MTVGISGFGLRVVLTASDTFPAGITLTQFADDADPLDGPDLQIADGSMGLNGDHIVWSVANKIPMTLSLIPDSDDDRNLAILFENNRPGRGKVVTADIINATVVYPDGTVTRLINGNITNGIPFSSIASSKRKKSKTYTFAFENKGDS